MIIAPVLAAIVLTVVLSLFAIGLPVLAWAVVILFAVLGVGFAAAVSWAGRPR